MVVVRFIGTLLLTHRLNIRLRSTSKRDFACLVETTLVGLLEGHPRSFHSRILTGQDLHCPNKETRARGAEGIRCERHTNHNAPYCCCTCRSTYTKVQHEKGTTRKRYKQQKTYNAEKGTTSKRADLYIPELFYYWPMCL